MPRARERLTTILAAGAFPLAAERWHGLHGGAHGWNPGWSPGIADANGLLYWITRQVGL